ncbi:electron transport complex protein RnfB [Candidatus Kinetoplastibacterium blastocrithidii TCC012E]|uniref:Electron transport complex protein RnfB n=1 Tax=Candidatus Kinetoplastidibacterium blastocrithidiae TCC012E TaxID=1208922 RepID=M1M0V0_9PROT|nr:RnfABCDGE type electron transport complex subunit B [Candidatus Kinetoplastibacterium blastocrithidii]AFZ83781.1 electron transport complex protein RnfB [Candidatus Kinetoplastibacterium blastocrithidii (ex Strigomonas culicis)]AGF49906.1 electron transport complex protein RnfB [Candidatus Kinetoplastibacterium blastocrithidii TCC012E]
MSRKELISIIDDSLPQTQCKKCGYEDCMSYANAIVNENASISLCDPGGNNVTKEIADKLKLDETNQLDRDDFKKQLMLAYVEEDECIGCTLCIKACPVSAIIGSNKLMHSVIQDWCTGCELCLKTCPVDCIKMKSSEKIWTKEDAETARKRYKKTKERIYKNSINNHSLMSNVYDNKHEDENIGGDDLNQKNSLIAKILKKARDMRTD